MENGNQIKNLARTSGEQKILSGLHFIAKESATLNRLGRGLFGSGPGHALFAFLILPGIVAFAIPPIIADFDPWKLEGTAFGAPLLVLGGLVLILCARDFLVSGRGTLAPWNPPKELVLVGFYRYCRNPMYLGVLILMLGWALALGSPLLGLYGLGLGTVFHLQVIFYEEPRLLLQFPDGWASYRERVPRWIPKSTVFKPE